ncbi:hypothetical protein BCONGLO52_10000 [Brachybacterium conglomeratum]|uniref:Uncharacterized protein n=1 Tax=Brachybacterium conglomeratum TaxID=47846 RepID=A0ABQ5RGC7_9MICO|nr:hypothetical protein BCONGLO52_10000 [Brachybacterium conglomeratum]GLK04697.1 hypothetical protein GCM10017597_14970 [Brachybacterium conglomeratum]
MRRPAAFLNPPRPAALALPAPRATRGATAAAPRRRERREGGTMLRGDKVVTSEESGMGVCPRPHDHGTITARKKCRSSRRVKLPDGRPSGLVGDGAPIPDRPVAGGMEGRLPRR